MGPAEIKGQDDTSPHCNIVLALLYFFQIKFQPDYQECLLLRGKCPSFHKIYETCQNLERALIGIFHPSALDCATPSSLAQASRPDITD